MTQKPELYARFAAILSMEADTENHSVLAHLRGEDDRLYCLDVPEPIIGSFVIGLLSQAKVVAPDQTGGESRTQPMNLNSGRPFRLGDGRIGLELLLEDVVRLPVLFPRSAIAVLRTALKELERLSQTAPPERKPH